MSSLNFNKFQNILVFFSPLVILCLACTVSFETIVMDLVRIGLMSNRRLAYFNRHRYCFLLVSHTSIIPYISSLSSLFFNLF
jgi:hypothetical protein